MHSSSAQTLLDLSELFTRTLWRQLVTASCVLFAGTMIIRHYRRADLKHTIPSFPGPKGLPLLGNIHQLEDKQWLKYTGAQLFHVPDTSGILIPQRRMA